MQQIPFRLYSLFGCPHCEEALKFLIDKCVINGQFGFQSLAVNQDPIAMAGVRAVTGKEEFPVLMSFITNEVIKGFNKEEYERLARVFNDMFRTGAPNVPAAESNNSGQAEVVAQPEAQPAQATASV